MRDCLVLKSFESWKEFYLASIQGENRVSCMSWGNRTQKHVLVLAFCLLVYEKNQ